MSTSTLSALAVLAAPLALSLGQAGTSRPAAEAPRETFETLTRKLRDGVVMTADRYTVEAFDEALATEASGEGDEEAAAGDGEPRQPWGMVVALHADRASRGEYRGVAPELNRLGLEVLAVDLRAGKKRFRVENETAASYAAEIGGTAKPDDCFDDVAFAVRWARELQPDGPLILFGSGSSAALALVYASRDERDEVDAVFCFSPGDYLRSVSVQEEAGKLQIPVYATCGPGRKESTWARLAVALIDKAYLTTYFPPGEVHSLPGAQTLVAGDAANREAQWRPVRAVLDKLREDGG